MPGYRKIAQCLSLSVLCIILAPIPSDTPLASDINTDTGSASRSFAPTGEFIVTVPPGSASQELLLELRVPDHRLRTRYIDGTSYRELRLPGYGVTDRTGAPQVPVKGFLLAVPEGATLDVEVLRSDARSETGYRLCPAPRRNVQFTESGFPQTTEEYLEDGAIYSSSRLWPPRIVEIGSYGYIRDVRVAQVQVFPVQYRPAGNEILVHRRIQLRFTIRGGHFSPIGRAEGSTRARSDPFEAIYQRILVNYGGDLPRSPGLGARPVYPSRDLDYLAGDSYKLSIRSDGIYGLGYQDLVDAGIDPEGIDPRTVKLHNLGVEVPLVVYGESDGSFDTGDAVVFFGCGNTGDYSLDNIYWLTWGGDTGMRMPERGVSPGDSFPVPDSFLVRMHLEKDERYYSNVYNGEGKDHWFWAELKAPPTATWPFPLSIAADPVGPLAVNLTVGLRGKTSGTHRTEVLVNNNEVDNFSWSGMEEYEKTCSFSNSYIYSGRNLLMVRCSSGLLDQYYVNWFDIEYWRGSHADDNLLHFSDPETGPSQYEIDGFTGDDIELFDITEGEPTTRFTGLSVRPSGGSARTLVFEDTVDGREYIALRPSRRLKPHRIVRDDPSDLHSPSRGADYIIITHEDFTDALQPLVDLRRSDGLRVTMVKIDDVYDEFSYGNTDPGAIREFLAYAYDNWHEPPPSYVLLVGDASYDYKGNLSGGNINYVPTHLFISQSEYVETSSDDWFACIIGDDRFPELLVGRISAQTVDDVSSQVEKVVTYETALPPGDWRKRILLIADPPDEGGDFESVVERFAANYIIPAGFIPYILYVRECNPNCKQLIIDAVDEGVVICNFIGHGSIDIWSKSGILHSTDIQDFSNGDRLPFFVTFDCLNGFFHHAVDDYCIAEELVRATGKGAVACWSHSGLDYTTSSSILGDGLYEALLLNGNYVLGSAVYRAKVRYLSLQVYFWDQAVMLILFGDPALEMGFPGLPDLMPGFITFEPGSPEAGGADTVTVSLFNAGREDAAGVTVRFTAGHPDSSGSLLIADVTVPHIPAGGLEYAVAYWDSVPDAGIHAVFVQADPGNAIVESCEWNNIYWDSIRVRSPGEEYDTIPPVVELFIDGKNVGTEFHRDDFASISPVITATMLDEGSGINIDELDVRLNGETVTDYILEHEGNGSNLIGLTFHPDHLHDGRYVLDLSVQDCSSDTNYTTATIRFVVESVLHLRDVRNYPNPWNGETTFSFYLSQEADDVVIRIYSVSGALVRTIRSPQPGYRNQNLVNWDGVDRYGNRVVSGVYFYTVTAIGGTGRDRIAGKLVILR
ncbi:MAG: T9SS type A sorting domain-containing protein [bacterium]|nr:MAG: T9SS type A sorting domain-containing protein [bacterium]